MLIWVLVILLRVRMLWMSNVQVRNKRHLHQLNVPGPAPVAMDAHRGVWGDREEVSQEVL